MSIFLVLLNYICWSVIGETSVTCKADSKDATRACSHDIPVIMIHWNLLDCSHCQPNPDFLQESVDVASRSGNRVILLGSNENKNIAGAEWHDVALYMASAAQFEKVVFPQGLA